MEVVLLRWRVEMDDKLAINLGEEKVILLEETTQIRGVDPFPI